MKNVIGEKIAIPIVAVRPGRAPMTIPMNVPRKIIRIVFNENMRFHASTKWLNMCIYLSL